MKLVKTMHACIPLFSSPSFVSVFSSVTVLKCCISLHEDLDLNTPIQDRSTGIIYYVHATSKNNACMHPSLFLCLLCLCLLISDSIEVLYGAPAVSQEKH